MDFLVGTFNTPCLYTLRFTPTSELLIVHRNPAVGSHSWLALSPDKRRLYATAWLAKPAVVAYDIQGDHSVKLISEKQIKNTSGYVAASKTHLYSAGGASGEVFALDPDGSIGPLIQELDFLDHSTSTDAVADNSGDAHGGFGGLRHGAHSVDLRPDGRALYVADIGRNCIWSFQVDSSVTSKEGVHLQQQAKHVSPRSNDGPRHTTPHPNGQLLYSVQEHSGMVDVFRFGSSGTTLEHVQGCRIMPDHKLETDFWADEVRLSAASDGKPHYLYASTRGLRPEVKGYVSAYRLHENGLIDGDALHMWQTPTSGGIANAVEPAPLDALATFGVNEGIEYLALTDSLEGLVLVLRFDGQTLSEAARVKLPGGVQAATAVWLPLRLT